MSWIEKQINLPSKSRRLIQGATYLRKGDHIRDPHTGLPVRGRQAAWVSGARDVLGAIGREAGAGVSPTAVADALSTAFMLMSESEIDRYCQAHGVEAWIVEHAVSHFPVGGY